LNLLNKKHLKIPKLFNYFFKNDLINNYRIKIDTGFACNANCFFCYYKNFLKDPFMDKSKVFFQIKTAKNLNFKKVEFSGGESSYHPEWFNFLDFAKNLDLKISTLSNGFMFSNYNFLKKSKERGLEEILFSLHSFKDNHDKHLGIKGAFNKIIKAIKNSLDLNLITRINITITPSNQKYLTDLFEFLDKENIFEHIMQYNFLPINEWRNAENIGKKSQDKIDLKNLYSIFDKIINLKKDNILNIRYYPYCLIDKKYHEFLKNYLDHYIDKFDWHPFFIYYDDYKDLNKIKNFKKKSIFYYTNHLKYQRDSQYYYEKHCDFCEFKNICDGYKKGFKGKE